MGYLGKILGETDFYLTGTYIMFSEDKKGRIMSFSGNLTKRIKKIFI